MNNNKIIILDTETTGLNCINKENNNESRHRIIEIAAIEIINRNITNNIFHEYINPDRKIDIYAYKIHKIDNNFLKNKPYFYQIYDNFIKFIKNSELIIHNSKFDLNFINYELSLIKNNNIKNINEICKITDSLLLARKKFPNKRNSLSALCERYKLNRNIVHNALEDTILLAKIYLLLTGGQSNLDLKFNTNDYYINNIDFIKKLKTKIIYANKVELENNKKYLQYIEKKYKLFY